MAKKSAKVVAPVAKCRRRHRCSKPRKLLALAALGVAAAAVAQEMKKPAAERTWHGFVAGLVPYDFRVPTVDRAKERLWNPQGPVIGPKTFGVGWDVNFGRLVEEAKALAEDAE